MSIYSNKNRQPCILTTGAGCIKLLTIRFVVKWWLTLKYGFLIGQFSHITIVNFNYVFIQPAPGLNQQRDRGSAALKLRGDQREQLVVPFSTNGITNSQNYVKSLPKTDEMAIDLTISRGEPTPRNSKRGRYVDTRSWALKCPAVFQRFLHPLLLKKITKLSLH